MNTLTSITLLALGLFLNASQPKEELKIEKENIKITKGFTIVNQDYTVYLDVETDNNQNTSLILLIELPHKKSNISPLNIQRSKGKLYMDFGDYTNIGFNGIFKEVKPHSNDSYASIFMNTIDTQMIYSNTIYRHAIKIKPAHDFEVFGRIQFSFKENYALENIPFALSYENGKITLIKDVGC